MDGGDPIGVWEGEWKGRGKEEKSECRISEKDGEWKQQYFVCWIECGVRRRTRDSGETKRKKESDKGKEKKKKTRSAKAR